MVNERDARERIDAHLADAGWVVQDRRAMNLAAGRGVAVREYALASGHGFADYLLFVDERAVGVLEAKRPGTTLTSVEIQADKYATGLPRELVAPVRPLPFVYVSTGTETAFVNLLDPAPRTRQIARNPTVPHIHRPETLAGWLAEEPLRDWTAGWVREPRADYAWASRPATFRSRVRHMPPVPDGSAWHNVLRAVRGIERSLAEDHPRALVQMATGSGKTRVAVTAAYRLIRYGGARRILFLVDRSNLGEQADGEFHSYETPEEHRKFTELYNVQLLQSNRIAPSTKVVVTTIQRLFSMLKGEPDLDPGTECGSQFDVREDGGAGGLVREPVSVAYNPAIPPEFFDVVFVDECHRSIYSLWRQVLDYFDATFIGLTATPSAHTYAFFDQNVVMEYRHEQAVADHVNVDFEVYRIRTRITEQGGKVEAGPEDLVEFRDRATRARRWDRPDEPIEYGAKDLDRDVVAPDQIRTVLRAFRERCLPEMFPGRKQVPKTLIFCKDDSHADDVVRLVREVFGEGNEFARKITYKTTEARPKELIGDFRKRFLPRIAVTVDMIATGTDIKPVEVVLFLRAVKSRLLFEQMKGRGVRVCPETEFADATPDVPGGKTFFVVVDAVGVTEQELSDTFPLEKKRTVSFETLLEHVASGGTHPAFLSSLASRLTRLDLRCDARARERISAVGGGCSLPQIAHDIVQALDPDVRAATARAEHGLAAGAEPSIDQLQDAGERLAKAAVRTLATNPDLRETLSALRREFEQVIDVLSKDEVLAAGRSAEATAKAKSLVRSFEEFLAANRDRIDALSVFYAQPYGKRLQYDEIKALADLLAAPPRGWEVWKLWQAYAAVDPGKVRGSPAERALADVVSLVRFAIHRDQALVPHVDRVRERFAAWMAAQRAAGKTFTEVQTWWLERIRDHVAQSVEIRAEDLDYVPFHERGGMAGAAAAFGPDRLAAILREMNEVLAA